ncbi:hypothetical protein XELAEV_18000269mg [Xenopus laevis]|uniref:Uncharacterized protein n=1 Tax=Xenopus laevis TaxID=8355 RepID=A0A974BPK3_XENLA|nr:hypothetical protein XELAEV_18000269mg [Xenopus laevis]
MQGPNMKVHIGLFCGLWPLLLPSTTDAQSGGVHYSLAANANNLEGGIWLITINDYCTSGVYWLPGSLPIATR